MFFKNKIFQHFFYFFIVLAETLEICPLQAGTTLIAGIFDRTKLRYIFLGILP